jgi:hypothetical protein
MLAACKDEHTSPAPVPVQRPHVHGAVGSDDDLLDLADRPIGSLDHATGVPLDATAVGKSPGPFGDVAVVPPGTARRDVATRLPKAHPDGARVVTATNVADVTAVLSFDRADEVDVVTMYMPASARGVLVAAWGQPDDRDTWRDASRHLRVDLGADRPSGQITATIESFRRFGDVVAEMPTLVGARRVDVQKQFGAHLFPPDPMSNSDDAHTLEVLVSATELCKVATAAFVDFTPAGTVERVVVRQCYADDAARRAALAAMETAWGKATPVRSPTDRPAFSFDVPGGHHALATIERDPDSFDEIWQIVLTQ